MYRDSELNESVWVNRIVHEVSCIFRINKRVENDRDTDCGIERITFSALFFDENLV